MDDLFAVFQRLDDNLRNYERRKDGFDSPYDEVLANLQTPYGPLRNYDEFLAVMQKSFSEDAARVWFAYPDYTLTTRPRSVEEAAENMDASLAGRAGELTQELLAADMLCDMGEKRYTRNYLFGIVFNAIFDQENHPFAKVAVEWWNNQCEGDSARFRATVPEYRIQPHQGVLDGESKHGRVPMNLEIPDQRQMLPMDDLDSLLEAQSPIVVIDCMCRLAQDHLGKRKCDFPIQDACFLFNEPAQDAIDMGFGRQITAAEAKELVRKYRDMGLVQEISNAAHPLSMCNCCECCCLCLLSMKRYETTVAVPSRWQADSSHVEDCIGCGKCVASCFMDAISFETGVPQVKGSICAGCGLCAANCPQGVLKMIRRAGAPEGFGRDKPERIYV